jgi:hypothetical protein
VEVGYCVVVGGILCCGLVVGAAPICPLLLDSVNDYIVPSS